ncbi:MULTISPECIES: hypothetical protein [Nitrosospira]|uniref:hypothetical protein n=1 Tax=Nitrosospira TaxID=35798 RepID=UPI0011B1E87F|nr:MULTISPECIES: hypothetical protein [Nitrosospira]
MTRFLVSVATLFATANALLPMPNAYGFAFLSDQRMVNPDFGARIGPRFIPVPVHWTNATLMPSPVPGAFAQRTLNITFNTAPGFIVPVTDRPALANAVTTWSNRNPLAANNIVANPDGFPAGTPVKVLGGQNYDLESILLHELGHAFGLDHPNLADRSTPELDRATASTKGNNGIFDLGTVDGIPGNFNDNRGDDLSLHLVDQDNNPFSGLPALAGKEGFFLDGPFVTGGYAQAPTRVVASAGRIATGFDAIANLEAVMVQGLPALESHRALALDDAQGLFYLETGVDQQSRGDRRATLLDNYMFNFVFNPTGVANAGGAPPAGTQILVNNTRVAPRLGETVFQRPLANAVVRYDIDAATNAALAQTDIWLDGPIESLGSQIQFVDITYYDTLGPIVAVPAPATLSLVAIGGLLLLGAIHRKRVDGHPGSGRGAESRPLPLPTTGQAGRQDYMSPTWTIQSIFR